MYNNKKTWHSHKHTGSWQAALCSCQLLSPWHNRVLIACRPSPNIANNSLTRQGKWIIILLIPIIKIRKDISPMNTVCNTTKFTCQMPGGDRRRIEADFSGGTITSDAGILL